MLSSDSEDLGSEMKSLRHEKVTVCRHHVFTIACIGDDPDSAEQVIVSALLDTAPSIYPLSHVFALSLRLPRSLPQSHAVGRLGLQSRILVWFFEKEMRWTSPRAVFITEQR